MQDEKCCLIKRYITCEDCEKYDCCEIMRAFINCPVTNTRTRSLRKNVPPTEHLKISVGGILCSLEKSF